MQTNDDFELGEWLTARVARLRRRKDAPWSELEIRERRPIALFGLPTRRLDLLFTLGPLSNQYPTNDAREIFETIPNLLQHAVDDGVPEGGGRAYFGEPRRDDEIDDEEHLTLRVSVPMTLQL